MPLVVHMIQVFWVIIITVDKPEGFHEIQRLCSKNQLITSLYKMFTILFVLLVIHFQVFHLTEKLNRITLYEYTVCCNHTGLIFDLNDRKQGYTSFS